MVGAVEIHFLKAAGNLRRHFGIESVRIQGLLAQLKQRQHIQASHDWLIRPTTTTIPVAYLCGSGLITSGDSAGA
jgi:hypothetical protein